MYSACYSGIHTREIGDHEVVNEGSDVSQGTEAWQRLRNSYEQAECTLAEATRIRDYLAQQIHKADASSAAQCLNSNRVPVDELTIQPCAQHFSYFLMSDQDFHEPETVHSLRLEMNMIACEVAKLNACMEPKDFIMNPEHLQQFHDDSSKITALKRHIAKLNKMMEKPNAAVGSVSSATALKPANRKKKRNDDADDDCPSGPNIGPLDKSRHTLFNLPRKFQFHVGKALKDGYSYAEPQDVFSWMANHVKACAELAAINPDVTNIVSVRRLNDAWERAHRHTKFYLNKKFLGVREIGHKDGANRTPQHFSPHDVITAAQNAWPGVVNDNAIKRILSDVMMRRMDTEEKVRNGTKEKRRKLVSNMETGSASASDEPTTHPVASAAATAAVALAHAPAPPPPPPPPADGAPPPPLPPATSGSNSGGGVGGIKVALPTTEHSSSLGGDSYSGGPLAAGMQPGPAPRPGPDAGGGDGTKAAAAAGVEEGGGSGGDKGSGGGEGSSGEGDSGGEDGGEGGGSGEGGENRVKLQPAPAHAVGSQKNRNQDGTKQDGPGVANGPANKRKILTPEERTEANAKRAAERKAKKEAKTAAEKAANKDRWIQMAHTAERASQR